MEKLTFAMENYLEAIFELSSDGGGAHISDIAKKMNVTKASTNSAMATLAEKGLIVNEKYKEVYLTAEGRTVAEFTSRKHQTILRFFTQVLNIRTVVADTDACAIEHVISNDSIAAMRRYMDNLST
ncbi:MAG: metal-dependent transcriptional regulator [Acetanaerobacterium sp.]